MKKLLTFAGVIALAVAFGLAGAASAKRPEGAGGGPPGGGTPGGGSTSTVSQFSSPFVNLDCIPDPLLDPPVATCEVPDSTGEINSQGLWTVITSGLSGSGYYAICLDAVLAPEDTPFHLETLLASAGALEASGTIIAVAGDWVGLSLQIMEGMDCSGIPRQESGLTLTGSDTWLSQFSSPFVALLGCDAGPCGEVTDSKGLIYNAGDWAVLTYGLDPGIKYKVCVDAFIAPALVSTLPFRLASRSARKKGSFVASGNMVERYLFDGHWVGLSLRIYEEGGTDTCGGVFVQETGINITVP